MKITAIEPLVCQGGIKNWTFVRVRTDEGITGWGDATEWVRVQGHLKAMEDLSAVVIGEDPFNIERIWQRMWVASYAGGKDCNVGMTGIETALWDIVGKALGTPVYNILGGRCHERIRLYADYCDDYQGGFRGTTRWREGDTSQLGIAKQAEYIKSRGFTALKMHPVGLAERPAVTRIASLKAIDDTVAKVSAIRDVVGNELDICMDINNRLDLTSSMALAKALEPYRLLFFEDPIRQEESAESYRRLAEATSTPVGTGENLYTVWSFRNLLEIGGVDVLLPDICHTGVLQAKKIAALGEAYHVPVAPHNPNSPLSTVISGHVCAGIPNFLALEYYLEEREPPWRDDVMSPPLGSFIKDGHLELPAGPGWGVELDEKEIAKHPYREAWYSGLGSSWEDLEIT
ncbi:MAG: mandelate racemase/muconate lactonizing enzyme family protein [Gemmatimonadetes bacterium]|nr:mandelate racemase/muconate lactonizing enzyme family protein [Gemmatimonadota bacterium]